MIIESGFIFIGFSQFPVDIVLSPEKVGDGNCQDDDSGSKGRE
jgi:hypothetical protein